jgi:hypothetical protein
MMRRAGAFLLAAALSMPAWAQKWVDEKGRVYYGEKPPGISVKPAEMKGGAVSTPGASSQAGAAPKQGPVPKALPPQRPFANKKDQFSPDSKFYKTPPAR